MYISSQQGHVEVVKLLLSSGADVDKEDEVRGVVVIVVVVVVVVVWDGYDYQLFHLSPQQQQQQQPFLG